MPTYEYSCEKCGHEFECVQSMKDAALTTCTKEICPAKRWGKGKVRRAIGGGAGLIFKGSGFYITDYRNDSYKSAARSDSESSKPKTESKTDSKPATPAPAPAPAPAAAPAASSKPAAKKKK